ncbi:MAG: response regulator [Gemmatimonadota bacterium]
MKILIAEDDAVARRVLEASLTKLGHSVITAVDGAQAWEYFQVQEVDVVITDWMMPNVDGIELCRRMRAHPRARYVWVVMLTALGGKTCYLEGMEAGADDFVTKPVDRPALEARLRVAARVLGLQAEVKQLEGLLPICSYCKRIRDESDQWSQVEQFIQHRTAAQFSHGICPSCFESHVRPQLESMPPALEKQG